MEIDNSLTSSIDKAKKHYSSMFFLPSTRTSFVAVALLSMVIGFSSFGIISQKNLMDSLLLVLSIFIVSITADLLISEFILKGDPIFTLRRVIGLSAFSLGFWIVFILIGLALSFPLGLSQWVQFTLLGYAVIITLRIVVLMATSTVAPWKKALSVLLQPTLCIVAFMYFWAGISYALITGALIFLIICPLVGLIAVLLFFRSIEKFSAKFSSMASIPLFQAFLVDWVASINDPLEKKLEEMGQDTDVEVNMLKFDASKPKAAIIVPQVHPGPFKNVGSSLLPSLLKREFEKVYSCDTTTALGILGHELDLASQRQNQKIISQVINSAKFEASAGLASRSIKATEGTATAYCQIFGDNAILSFTLSPKTTEDLPQELGRFVREKASQCGLKDVLVINAHNCLTDLVDSDLHLEELKIAAAKCLEKAAAQPKNQFMVGGASIFPEEFSLKQGMGTGGITAVVVKVEDQKTAYIIIDGNNMIPNLREKILTALASAGFNESEVFTTDTHAVTGLVTGKDGYNSVGKAMDHMTLINYIVATAQSAESKLEVSRAGYLNLTVPQVRVIGEERLKSITALVDKAIGRAKQMIVPIFGLEGLVLVLLLIILIR